MEKEYTIIVITTFSFYFAGSKLMRFVQTHVCPTGTADLLQDTRKNTRSNATFCFYGIMNIDWPRTILASSVLISSRIITIHDQSYIWTTQLEVISTCHMARMKHYQWNMDLWGNHWNILFAHPNVFQQKLLRWLSGV